MNNPERHIIRSFDEELRDLRAKTINMGNLVSRSLARALHGLIYGNIEKCSEVIADDEAIDQEEIRIDASGMAILLRYHPVASDLRMVISTMNIARSIERIGDHAVSVAKRGRKILKMAREFEEPHLLTPLAEAASQLYEAALLAYADLDGGKAVDIVKDDDEVNQLHKKVSKMLTQMASEPHDHTEMLLHLLFIARALERVADLSANIGEDIFFITSADDIRHSG